MNCPSCGAPMRIDGRQPEVRLLPATSSSPTATPAASAVLTPSPDGEPCPVCNVVLMQAALGRSPLLYCTKCHGMLVAMMEFESLVDAARTASAPIPALPADPSELDRHINCPHCHRPMDAHFYVGAGNVVMDTCESCCLHWLDHDGLARIAQANPDQPNAIDSSDDAFYTPTADIDDNGDNVAPIDDAINLLTRILKPRI